MQAKLKVSQHQLDYKINADRRKTFIYPSKHLLVIFQQLSFCHTDYNIELSSKLVKAVNDNPSKLLQEIVQHSNQYDDVLEKIRILKSRIKEDEVSARIDFLICKLTNSEHFTNKIVKVMKNDKVMAILADNVIKPKIEMHCDTKEVDCKCIMKNQKITFTPQAIKHIDNLSYLDQIKNQPMIIKLYTHSYRSYSGFTCYILILTEKECLLIDTLKIRKVNHEIFKCNTYKYFHCKNCYYQFVQELCNVGCADIMNGSESVFCDWRIRPYNTHFEEIIQKDILELNEDYKSLVESKAQTQVQNIIEKKINDASLLMFNDLLDTHTDEYDANMYRQQDVNYDHLAEQFMHFYNISIENKNLLVEMIKLRNFIAKSNDESVFYTMTDTQLCKLVCVKPQTKNDFIECLERMSALVREHIFDFLMVIQSCTKNEFRADGKESSLIDGSSDLDTESKVNTSMTNGEIANESSTEELLKGVKRK